MRTLLLIISCGLAFAVTPARAEKHVFVIANNPDGYGVDRCLANGDTCGAVVATAYCQARDFAVAVSFHRVDRNETTGAVSVSADTCSGGGCDEFVAIECTR
jgi:hypothetical protein